eukprot:gene1337-1934_t
MRPEAKVTPRPAENSSEDAFAAAAKMEEHFRYVAMKRVCAACVGIQITSLSSDNSFAEAALSEPSLLTFVAMTKTYLVAIPKEVFQAAIEKERRASLLATMKKTLPVNEKEAVMKVETVDPDHILLNFGAYSGTDVIQTGDIFGEKPLLFGRWQQAADGRSARLGGSQEEASRESSIITRQPSKILALTTAQVHEVHHLLRLSAPAELKDHKRQAAILEVLEGETGMREVADAAKLKLMLGHTELFQSLDGDMRAELCQYARLEEIPQNTPVVQQGNEVSKWCFIMDGYVEVMSNESTHLHNHDNWETVDRRRFSQRIEFLNTVITDKDQGDELKERMLVGLAQSLQSVEFNKGAEVCRQGEYNTDIFIIKSGTVVEKKLREQDPAPVFDKPLRLRPKVKKTTPMEIFAENHQKWYAAPKEEIDRSKLGELDQKWHPRVPTEFSVARIGSSQWIGLLSAIEETPQPSTCVCESHVEAFVMKAEELMKKVPADMLEKMKRASNHKLHMNEEHVGMHPP